MSFVLRRWVKRILVSDRLLCLLYTIICIHFLDYECITDTPSSCQNGNTPLIWAAEKSTVHAINTLVRLKADVNLHNEVSEG